MKGKFCLSLFALCALWFGTTVGQEEIYTYETSACTPNSFNYLKLGVGGAKGGVKPSIGIGRRFGMQGAAIDISLNWTGTDTTGYFSLPKMLYLSYLTPCSPTSFYYGAGLSIGRIGSVGHKFSGLLAEAAIGSEMQRDTNMKLFAEIDFSHGLVPFNSKNGFHGFSPAVAFTVGAGF